MPKYTVLTTAADERRQIIIEDDRELEALAALLGKNGYLITTDVTPVPGQTNRPHIQIALFRTNVVAIK